jgi:hypothetical protein
LVEKRLGHVMLHEAKHPEMYEIKQMLRSFIIRQLADSSG